MGEHVVGAERGAARRKGDASPELASRGRKQSSTRIPKTTKDITRWHWHWHDGRGRHQILVTMRKGSRRCRSRLRFRRAITTESAFGVWLLLGNHEFAAAVEKATALNKRAPDDVMVWGFLTDANVELGNYADAEKAAQWMLNLRPRNLPAMTRAAYLRELFGDPTARWN